MKELKGKRLLVLCGNAIHVKVVKAAKEMGVYTIVTDGLSIENAPAKKIADEALYINVLDVDSIVEYCTKNPVDGVINFCNDIAQRPQQQICERLGLPCYGTPEQYFMLTDKNAFKEMCKKYNVDTIPQYSDQDVEDDKIDYPVLVKPVDSRGSRGQTVCNNKEELIPAIAIAKRESSNGLCIIEKYMSGKQDFSMSYIFKNGEAHLTRTGDRYLGKESDGLHKQCIGSISPSLNTNMYLKNVHTRVVSALKEIGIKNGPVFMQGFIDGDTVRFYDPGIRLPGTEYESLLHQATGINLMKELITLCLGGEICDYNGELKNAYQLNGKLSIQLLVSARGGRIAAFDGLEEIAKHPNVVTVSQRYFVGETIPQTGDVKQRICEIVVLTERSEAKKTIEWIQSKLIVKDENGENMLVSQLDPSVLRGV